MRWRAVSGKVIRRRDREEAQGWPERHADHVAWHRSAKPDTSVAARRRLLCAAPNYLSRRGQPILPEDLAGHDCLCFTDRDEAFRWRFQDRSGAKRSLVVKGRMCSNDADILVEAAVAGLGVFYTTDWHVGPHLASGALVEVMPEWQVPDGGGVFVLTASSQHLPSKTRAFSDWIAEALASPPWNAAA